MKKITLLVALMATISMNAQLIFEGFDDITSLVDYTVYNVSDSPNTDIFQGNDTVFPSHAGASTAYLGMNFNATAGSTIDLYLVLPAVELENGDVMTFWTRTGEGSTFPDRLEVVLDPDGSATPPTSTDPGSYTELLLEINPTLATGGYPEAWELQTVTVAGLSGPTTTSLAFRYWVTDAGPAGANSNYIGIDTLEVNETLGVDETALDSFRYFVDSNNQLNLAAATAMESIVLHNVLGQQVASQRLTSNSEVLDLSGFNTGMYLATVTIDGNSKTVKIIKK
tara:strand:+ start:286 stop:1131 length:846 start_codon:yes stop_codon:yes gene_type:complete